MLLSSASSKARQSPWRVGAAGALLLIIACVATQAEENPGSCACELDDEIAAAASSIVPGVGLPGDLGWGDAPSTDWGGNFEYSASKVFFPESTERVQELVRKSCKVRVVGTRQSCNDVAQTRDTLISLKKLTGITLDGGKVVASGGATFSSVMNTARNSEKAFSNVPSHPHINVVGAVSTGSHGSGHGNGILGTLVSHVTFVNATGGLETLREGEDADFQGAVVALGALGPVVSLGIKVRGRIMVGQCVYGRVLIHEVLASWPEMVNSGYSISLFTSWASPGFNSAWVRHELSFQQPGRKAGHCSPYWYGAPLHTYDAIHPIYSFPPRGVTKTSMKADMSTLGTYTHEPWRDPGGNHEWSEYFIPLELLPSAILELFDNLMRDLWGVAMVSEVRVVKEDDLWLSPCYERACASISFEWNSTMSGAVAAAVPAVEAILMKFDAAPHWGGRFAMSPYYIQMLPVYRDVIPKVREMLARRDPGGKFRNEFVDRYVFEDATGGAWRRAEEDPEEKKELEEHFEL